MFLYPPRSFKNRALGLAVLGALLLAGCGGGGSSSSVSQPTQTTNIQITRTNSDSVAASAYLSASSSAGYNKLGSGATTSATVLSAQNLAHALAAGGDAAIAASNTVTMNCLQGGTESFTVSDTNGNLKIDSGDFISIGFANCKGSDGTAVNGAITLTVNSFSGNFSSGTGNASFSILFSSLNTTDTYGSFLGNGTLGFSLVQNGTQSFTIHSTAPGFAVSSSNSSGTQLRSLVLQSATTDIAETSTTLTSTFSQSGTVTSTAVTGSYDLTTEIPVVYALNGGTGPTSGKIRIAGTKSTLWITFLSNGQVQLDLDETGGGTVSVTKTINLSDLRKL